MFPLIKIAKAAIVECGNPGQARCGWDEFYGLIHNLLNFAIYISIIAVGASAIYAGVMILVSGGNEERVKVGKKAITASVTGIVIVFLAWIIVNTVITAFTNCNSWNVFGGIRCS